MQPSPARNPAELYEAYFVPAMFQRWAQALIERAQPAPGMRALDVACGTGVVARMLAPRLGPSGSIVAVDINPAMLAIARALPPAAGAPIDWREGNAQAIPLPDTTIDLVLCQHGLQFFPDRAAALREMRRVLVPGGRAAVIVLQALAQHPVFEALMTSVARQLSVPVAAAAMPFALSDSDTLQDLVVASGFARVELHAASIDAVFPTASRFVPLAIASSAAAIPAFAQLADGGRAALFAQAAADVEPVLAACRRDDTVSFPMHAHIVIAHA
jgi:ubiquinone/menaquinone biosynthesis C-methylase UbiE